MDINKIWQEAPEGAEYYGLATGRFYKFENGSLKVFLSEWKSTSLCLNDIDAIKRPETTWKEGELPPVGTVCEALSQNGHWCKCEVLAHHNGKAVLYVPFDAGIDSYDAVDSSRIRPLRTNEQISEKEMKKQIGCMIKDAGVLVNSPTVNELMTRLYDAGYRKL